MELFTLFGRFATNAKDVEKDIDSVTGRAKGAEGGWLSSFGNMAKSVGSFGLSITKNLGAAAWGGMVTGMTSISKGMSSLTRDAIGYNAKMENFQTNFQTMLGSADKAQQMIGGLKDFAAKTPFEMGDLAQGAQTLLAFGRSAEQIQPELKMLGDISMGNKEKLNGLTTVFGQVASQGKLMGGDLMQMINNGFNPLQVMSQKSGESMESLKDKMSKGQISFEMVADAMKTATSEGGQFYNAMDNASKTWDGQVSTIKDNVSTLKGTLMQGFTSGLASSLPIVTDTLGQMQNVLNTEGVAKFAEFAPKAITDMLNGFTAQLPNLLQKGTEVLQALMNGLSENADAISNAVMTVINGLVTFITNNLPMILDTGLKILESLMNGISNNIGQWTQAAIDLILKLVDTLMAHTDQLIDAGFKILMGVFNGIVSNADKIGEAAGQLAGKLVSVILNTNWLDIGWQILSGIGKGLMSGIGGVISGFGNSLLDGVKSFFHIKSPSKLFEDEVGTFLAQGVSVGFTGEMHNLKDDMGKSVLNTTKEAINKGTQTQQLTATTQSTNSPLINQPIIVQSILDGKIIAETLAPLSDIVNGRRLNLAERGVLT